MLGRRRATSTPTAVSGPALVSHVSAAFPGPTGPVTTAPIATTGATLIVIAVVSFESGTNENTPTDSHFNTWTPMTLYKSNNTGVIFYYAKNPTTGAAHTFTLPPTASAYAACCVAAFNGTLLTGTNDIDVGNHNALGATTVQAGSATPAHNNEIVVAAVTTGDAGAVSIDSGFTITDQVPFLSATHFGVGLAYLAQGVAAAANPTWTVPGGGVTYTANAAMASFQ